MPVVQPIKRQQILSILGDKAGHKLLSWLDPCCNSFCDDIDNCLGISSGGNPNLVLNQQGDWIQSGGLYIGAPIIGADPNLFLYTDNSGNLYQDQLAFRDSVTNQTIISYRTSAGQYTNALKLGNILGSFIQDGVGFERHDAISDTYSFAIAGDLTSQSGHTNSSIQGFFSPFDNTASRHEHNIDGQYLFYSTNDSDAGISITNSELYFSRKDIINNTSASFGFDQFGVNFAFRDNNTNKRLITELDSDRIKQGDLYNNGNRIATTLDDLNSLYKIYGLFNSINNTYGNMFYLNGKYKRMYIGDVDEISNHMVIGVDDGDQQVYINGLDSLTPLWTPSILSDGFTGTGLNDMHYDSTTTYTGGYSNTYTATIVTINSVYLQLLTIGVGGFNIGDTVTDGSGSTGTIIAGGDSDGFIIINPIVDLGWTSATSISDISSGANSTVVGVIYTDTFSWSSTKGGGEVNVACNNYISLGDGLTVGFYSPTGHTFGDQWEFTMYAGHLYSKIAKFDGGDGIVRLGDVDGVKNNTYVEIDERTKKIKFNSDSITTFSEDIPITVKVNISDTQLATMGSIPIEVIPAPGNGKGIQPLSCYAEYTYRGSAYSNFGIPGLTHNPSSGSLPLKTTVSLLDQTANYVRFFKPTDEGYNAGFTIDNQPLYFTDDDTSDPTSGNGLLTLYITYKIIKL